MNYCGHAGNQYTGSEGEQGLAPGKFVILRQAWMEHGYYYCLIILNLGKMNFTYQVINCTNVCNFRIILMVNGFPTG